MVDFVDRRIPTVLIVDDMKVNLILISELLEDYNVITASSGEEAIKIAKEKMPDLILLDIVMPGMDGYEVCLQLKSDEDTKDIPVIFATSKTDEESIEKAYSVGGIDYVTKPFKPKELLARVKIHVEYAFVKKDLDEKIKLIDKNVSYSSTDTDGIIIEVSDAFCKISGYTKEELIGQNHSIVRHPDMDKKIFTDLWRTIKKGDSWRGEIKNRKKNGLCFWADVVITPIMDNNNKAIKYTAIRHDISDQKKVEVLSITDQLTNLYNRRHFNDALPIEIRRAIRHGSQLSFLMFDIDYFKQYNDTYGHQAGDNVLSRLGELLQQKLSRAGDLIFRLGGEEFGMIFTSNSAQSSIDLAESIREAVMKLKIEHEKSKIFEYMTISAGLVCIDFSKDENREIDEGKLYKLADEELYKSKFEGRNRVNMLVL